MKKQDRRLPAAELLRHLSKKLGAVTDADLRDMLGLAPHVLRSWKREDKMLSALQVAGAINKARTYVERRAHSHTIRAIVEFFPIERTAVGRNGDKFAVTRVGPEAGKHLTGLRTALESAKSGLYIFYDTRGCALYAGQTKRQNVWKEMNSAFNRTRSAQVMTLVKHPTNDVEFRPASLKVRQPSDQILKLHDLARYFSAYEVLPEMIDDLEALLVRAFPNDLLNLKMEKFGKLARSAENAKVALSTN